MQIHHGLHTSWVQIQDDDIPGVVYVGLDLVDGQPRITQLYIDGRGEPIQPGALRRFPLSAIEQLVATWTDDAGNLLPMPGTKRGPNLSLLAARRYNGVGSEYRGRDCPTCSAPLKGRENRPEALGREEAITDWTKLEWLARFGTLPQPKMPREQAPHEPEPIRLSAPEHGLTDEFLQDVGRAYRAAVAQRMPPAKTLGEIAGVDRRTVESWVYKARKRGIMEPAVKKGRIV